MSTAPVLNKNLILTAWILMIIAGFIAFFSLVGWQFNISFLIRPLPKLVAMNPLTAICFLLTAACFYFRFRKVPWVGICQLLAGLILLLSVLKIAGTIFPSFLQVDELIYPNKIKNEPAGVSDKMAMNTAFNFLFLALAYLLYDDHSLKRKLTFDLLAILTGLMGYFTLMAYVYRVDEFYQALRFFPMSVHTALSFFLIGNALLFVKPDLGLISVFTGNSQHSKLALNRTLMAFLLPGILGFLQLQGEWASLYSMELGTLLLVLAVTIILIFTIWYNSYQLGHNAIRVQRTEEALNETQQQFGVLADNIQGSAVILLDAKGKVKTWNQGAAVLFDYNYKEAVGLQLDVFYGDTAAQKQKAMDNLYLARQDGSFRTEGWRYRKDGSRFWADVLYSPIRDTSDSITGFIKIIQDLTERHLLLEELQTFNQRLESEVADKTRQLTNMMERITVGFIALDANYRYVYANRAVGEMTGKDPEALIGKNIWDEFPEAANSQTRKDFERSFEEQVYIANTDYHPGTDFYQENYIYPSREGLTVFIRDITPQRKAEIAAEDMEVRTQAIMETALDGVIVLSKQGEVKYWNPQAEKIFGWTAAEAIGRELGAMIIPDQTARTREGDPLLLAAQPKNGQLRNLFEIDAIRKNDRQFPMEIAISSFQEGEETFYCAFVRDITERKKAAEALRESRNELRALASHLQEVREEERVRIAREIHDVLGQQLTVIKMDTAWLKKHLPEADNHVQVRLGELSTMLDESVKTVRKIATDLRPSILDDLGLITTIEWQLKEFGKRTGIDTFFEHHGGESVLTEAIKTGLFRMFQESLTNVARHAHASKLNVELDIGPEKLMLTVTDNGQGFEPDKVKSKKTLGLLGMQERVLMINGQQTLQSSPGEGTRVIIEVPLKNEQYI